MKSSNGSSGLSRVSKVTQSVPSAWRLTSTTTRSSECLVKAGTVFTKVAWRRGFNVSPCVRPAVGIVVMVCTVADSECPPRGAVRVCKSSGYLPLARRLAVVLWLHTWLRHAARPGGQHRYCRQFGPVAPLRRGSIEPLLQTALPHDESFGHSVLCDNRSTAGVM